MVVQYQTNSVFPRVCVVKISGMEKLSMKKAVFLTATMVLSFVFCSCQGEQSLMALFECGTMLEALITSIISGIVVCLLSAFIVLICKKIRYRRLNKFWKPFKGKDISIVLSEYEIIGNTEDFEIAKKLFENSLISKKTSSSIEPLLKYIKTSKIAEKVANGVLISKGTAKALSNLMKYLPEYVTKTEKIFVDGDKSKCTHHDDLIIVGSPMSNEYARRIFSSLERLYDMPFDINYNDTIGEIKFVYKKDGTVFKPEIDKSNGGRDYAIIINAKYKTALNNEDRNVVILAGGYMYGVDAASKVITNRNIFKTISKYVKEINNCTFLIKAEIINGNLKEPELKINDKYYIFPLKTRC